MPIRQPTELVRLIREWFAEWPQRPGLDYQLQLPDAPCPTQLDRHQIRRLLGNLIRNAEQAQPSTGHVHLTLTLPVPQENAAPVQEGSCLLIGISDAGEGIHAETMPHVFEPYFTTRGEANATGLGLTVCESIVKAHGGTLTIESNPGQGTTIRVALPVSDPEPDPPPPGPSSVADDQKLSGTHRVLVLEDEPLIRQLIVSNLTAAGCEVTPTSEGSETVARYTEAFLSGKRYDLVVMDLSIPNGMGGAQAMEKIRQVDPGVRAIVSSGYSDDPIMSRYADYGFQAVLPKPYQPTELRELVTHLIAEARRSWHPIRTA